MKKVSIVIPPVNLKHLEITNSKDEYEKLKASGEIGVLIEPLVFEEVFGIKLEKPIYFIGIKVDI